MRQNSANKLEQKCCKGFGAQTFQVKLTETFKISFVRKAATFVYQNGCSWKTDWYLKIRLSAAMTSKVTAFISTIYSTVCRLDMNVVCLCMVRIYAPLTPCWHRFHPFFSASSDMLGLAGNTTLDCFHARWKSHCILRPAGAFVFIVAHGGMS